MTESRIQFCRLVFSVIYVSGVLGLSSATLAVNGFDAEGRGISDQALAFNKTRSMWFASNAGVFDGAIENTQAGSKTVDRRIGVGGGAGVEFPVAPSLSFRVSTYIETVKRRQIDSLVPETISDDTQVKAQPIAAITYLTPAGLELFGGGSLLALPQFTRTIETEYDHSTAKYSSLSLLAPHMGVTRRGGFGAAGFYYQFGKEEKRVVTKTAGDGSTLEFSERVQNPTTIGVYAGFPGLGAMWTVIGQTISEGEGGERTEAGTTIRDDHLKLVVNSLWGQSWDLGVGYRTARYSKSSYIDLDSIPLFNARLQFVAGDQGRQIKAGGSCSIGRDKQSIPEINANYNVNGCSLMGGVSGAF